MTTTQSQTSPSATVHVPEGVEVIPVLDFGGQYTQLIARRVREAGAFSLLLAHDTPIETLAGLRPRGVILSGGPASVDEAKAPRCDDRLFDLGVPVLGICYGMQIGCRVLGCAVDRAEAREFGRARLTINDQSDLLAGLPANTAVWMSHGDQVQSVSDDFDVLAATPTCPFAAVRHKRLPFYGVQFHPEVTHTPHGIDLLRNFLYEICRCTGTWRMSDFLETECKRVREQV
jgi:GMP synthase (glutamine-hydrolysing)